MDGADEVCGDLSVDLLIRELFRSTEQAVTGVADDHVYPAVPLECSFNGGVNAFRLDQVELNDIETIAVFLRKFRQRAHTADRGDHLVSLIKQLLCHLETEPRGGAGNEPCLWHRNS